MGNVILNFVDSEDASALVQSNLAFGEVQVEGTGFESGAANFLRERIGIVQHLLSGIARPALEDGEYLFVVEAMFRANYRGIEF